MVTRFRGFSIHRQFSSLFLYRINIIYKQVPEKTKFVIQMVSFKQFMEENENLFPREKKLPMTLTKILNDRITFPMAECVIVIGVKERTNPAHGKIHNNNIVAK